MKALSIRQPWCWAILNAGKDVENRDWFRQFRGRIAIHAAKGMTASEFKSANMFIRRVSGVWCPAPQTIKRGAIVGTVEIVGCVRQSNSAWFQGEYGFVLREPIALATPIPYKGALGFWDVPAEIEQLIAAGTSTL
jgi:hypothetical protein